MIGSDERKITAAVKRVLAEVPEATLSIKKVLTENGKLHINFDALGNTENYILNIALIEKKTITEVKAGENGGATLTNYNVVRDFKTIGQVNNGDNTSIVNMAIDSTGKKNSCVVLYLQEKNTNKISGADQSAL
jgi:hypothetical protein